MLHARLCRRFVAALLFGCVATPVLHAQAVRRDLGTLDVNGATLRGYQRAVAAMKNLPPSDPHSWSFQANIHGFPAGGGTVDPTWGQCQHANWWFLPWHRAYLHYVERIMRRYSGDPTFALPYWNYADPRQRTVPAAFRNPASPLYDGTRRAAVNAGRDGLSDFVVVQAANQSLANTVFANFDPRVTTFGGPALRQPQHVGGTFGTLENLPHNWIHSFVGGNMGDTDRAARDPLFFVHHANVDRLWEQWLRMGGGRANPADPLWLNQTFTFYDENKQRVTIAMRQTASAANLGYGYDSLGGTPATTATQTAGEANLRQVATQRFAEPRRIDTTTSVSLTPTHENPTSQVSQQPTPRETRVYLSVAGVEFAPQPDSALAVFINLPANGRNATPQDSHFAGYVSFFGSGHHHHGQQEGKEHATGAACTIDITPTFNRLNQAREWNWNNVTVTLQRVCPGTQRAAVNAVLTFNEITLLSQSE